MNINIIRKNRLFIHTYLLALISSILKACGGDSGTRLVPISEETKKILDESRIASERQRIENIEIQNKNKQLEKERDEKYTARLNLNNQKYESLINIHYKKLIDNQNNISTEKRKELEEKSKKAQERLEEFNKINEHNKILLNKILYEKSDYESLDNKIKKINKKCDDDFILKFPTNQSLDENSLDDRFY